MNRKKIIAGFAVFLLICTLFSLCGCDSDKTGDGYAVTLNDLEGGNIAVLSGSVFDSIAKKEIPGCKVVYAKSNPDLGVLLDTNKIKGYVTDEPTARLIIKSYPDQSILKKTSKDDYGFFFKKNDERGKFLCEQMNTFLEKIRNDGTLREIDNIWFGDDEDKQKVVTSDLTGENGVLKMALTTQIGMPFTYLKDNRLVGYDVDIAVRFCREYGYGIEFVDGEFSSMLAEVSTGKCDFGASCVTITDERKESVLFSDPDYNGATVIVAKSENEYIETRTLEDFTGKKIGGLTGSVFYKIATDNIKDCVMEYYDSYSDMADSLLSGKIDGYICEELTARDALKTNPELHIFGSLRDDNYGFIFPKDNEKAKELCEQMNVFLAEMRKGGFLEEMKDLWIDTNKGPDLDYESLPNENGEIHLAVTAEIGVPFTYFRDGKIVGYEVDLIYRFCKKYGYSLKITSYTFDSMLSSVSTGKCDVGAGNISITPERSESVLFSDPEYTSGSVLVVKKQNGTAGKGFFGSVASSFEKTFIRESRWKLFISGILTTLMITLTSVIIGTLLGFAVYMLCRSGGKIPTVITDALINFFEKTPVVVILMILYYIIFGKSKIDAVWVSMIGFTLIFASNVTKLIKVGVGTVDKSQTEAALALGYSDRQTFIRIIFPQALPHILPGYSSAVVSLIKDTAIVGYIAVQDLTKISDIIRSRTYEAFFPVIASAIIYFILALLLTKAVKYLARTTAEHVVVNNHFLKGVKRQ